MPDLDPADPLVKAYRAWKKWEDIATGHSTNGLPAPASLAELQFWGEMKNAYEARFQDDLRRHLAEHPELTRASVLQELDSLIRSENPR